MRTGLNTVEMHDCISLSVRMFSCEEKTGYGGSGMGRGILAYILSLSLLALKPNLSALQRFYTLKAVS